MHKAFPDDERMKRSTSSADWPEQWGKEYQAVLGIFHRVTVRKDGQTVHLYSRTHGCDEFGSVPVDIEPVVLLKLLPMMLEAYGKGIEYGRRDLARKIQAPIRDALDSARADAG